jgi:hypothetical protein
VHQGVKLGGLIALAALLVAPAFSVAATMPRAALAKKADAICKMENKRRAANPHPPKFSNPAKATPAQLKSAAGYLGRDLAITKDEVSRVFALGTPSEPAARTAWTRLQVVLTKDSLPAFAKAVADARKGQGKLVSADFAASSKFDAEQVKLQKALGLKVCGNG